MLMLCCPCLCEQECGVGMRAVVEGIGCVVPLVGLTLYTPDEIEALVCGKPSIDIGTCHCCCRSRYLWLHP